jgi:hypothetical protein
MVPQMDLKRIRGLLEGPLNGYGREYGLGLGDFELKSQSQRTYCARGCSLATLDGTPVGNMYILVFRPGEGTGDENTYKKGSLRLNLLRELNDPIDEVAVLPRSKEGVLVEGCFPLLSIDSEGGVFEYAVCLHELTVGGTPESVVPLGTIGMHPNEYVCMYGSSLMRGPQAFFTVQTHSNGDRFGDPHSIFYGVPAGYTTQIVGFLAIEDAESPLLGLAERWQFPREL